MDVISKRQAKERGLQTYFTGKECRRVHVCERYVSTSNCVDCAKAYSKRYNAALHPDDRRKHIIKSKYGLTMGEWHAMRKAQNDCCASCGDPFGDAVPNVDHDHSTGKVRAMLCRGCNTALGHLQECPEKIAKLIKYLAKHS